MNTLKFIWNINNSYRTNYLIYLLKKLSFINKHLPNNAYKFGNFKKTTHILSIIIGITQKFITKALYMFFIMVVFPIYIRTSVNAENFYHIIFMMSLCGIYNINLCTYNINYYYSIELFKTDPKEYILTDLFYNLILFYISYIPTMLISSMILKAPIMLAFIFPLANVAYKLITISIFIAYYKKFGKLLQCNKILTLPFTTIILLTLIYTVNTKHILSAAIIYTISAIFIITSIFSTIYIIKFDEYKYYWKELYNKFGFNLSDEIKKQSISKVNKGLKNTNVKNINLSGFKYLNKMFFVRYRKLLMKPYLIKNVLLVVIVIFLSIVADMNYNELKYIFIFSILIAYSFNNSKSIIDKFFIGCDRFLFQYNFFKDGKSIMVLFKIRLKSILLYDIISSLIIGTGFAAICLKCDIDSTKKLVISLLMFMLPIIFNILLDFHNMFMYYMFQPYTIDINQKGLPYILTNIVVYILVFSLVYIKPPFILLFCSVAVILLIYTSLGSYLIKRYAPERFRLNK